MRHAFIRKTILMILLTFCFSSFINIASTQIINSSSIESNVSTRIFFSGTAKTILLLNRPILAGDMTISIYDVDYNNKNFIKIATTTNDATGYFFFDVYINGNEFFIEVTDDYGYYVPEWREYIVDYYQNMDRTFYMRDSKGVCTYFGYTNEYAELYWLTPEQYDKFTNGFGRLHSFAYKIKTNIHGYFEFRNVRYTKILFFDKMYIVCLWGNGDYSAVSVRPPMGCQIPIPFDH